MLAIKIEMLIIWSLSLAVIITGQSIAIGLSCIASVFIIAANFEKGWPTIKKWFKSK